MAARPAPLLDLSTLVDRPQIAIDGERYDILSPGELSVIELHKLARTGQRLEHLGAIAAPSAAEQEEMLALIDELAARIMVGVPDDVRGRLAAPMLLRVIEVFTGLLPARIPPAGDPAPKTAPKAAAAGRSTGARSRRGSSASTAATRAGGSTAPRSRS